MRTALPPSCTLEINTCPEFYPVDYLDYLRSRQRLSGGRLTPEVVTLTGDPWPPYVIGTLGEEATEGSCIDLVQQVFARLNDVDVSFPLMPWERALREVRDGNKDGIVLLLKTPEREKYMAYTDPLFTSYNLVWYSKRRFPSLYEVREEDGELQVRI